VQKVPDERWMKEISEIYETYGMYHQSEGTEQSVLDPATNQIKLRSDLIARHLESRLPLRDGTTVLDVGCGTGATLEALATSASRLRLFGLEYDERNLPRLTGVRGFEKLFLGSVRDIPLEFDLVTFVHSLEHFPNPAQALASAVEKTSEDGALFVQVVDAPNNPFDLVIADHIGHFSADALRALARNQGLDVLSLETNLVRRELAMICRKSKSRKCPPAGDAADEGIEFATRNLSWLSAVLHEADRAASQFPVFGLFGSSIAATWLADALGGHVKFLVDEDPARIGRRHLDLPIVAPRDIPAGAGVYVGMASASADAILKRFTGSAINLIPPPRLTLQWPSKES
jgi:SAM-dependent methyltransferase